MKNKWTKNVINRKNILISFISIIFVILIGYVTLNFTSLFNYPGTEVEGELNCIYQNSSSVPVGDSQLIAVGFNNKENAGSSKLVYSKVDGKTFEAEPFEVAEEFVIFNLKFDNNEQVGLYNLDKIKWTSGEEYYENINRDYVNGNSFSVVESDFIANEDNCVKANINNTDINTGEVLENDNSQLYFSPEVQQSVSEYKSGSDSNEFVVAIDPGHGGSDPGACYGGYQEKWLNWTISQACANELSYYGGVRTYITRGADETVGLQDRVERARSAGANLFLCLHNNSGGGHGAEVWVQHAGGWHSEVNGIGCGIGNLILQKLGANLGLYNRGLKADTWGGRTYPDGTIGDLFAVLYWSRYYGIPGILVEHAFMDGGGVDAAALYNNANLDLMGRLDAQSVAEYYGFSKYIPKPYAKDVVEGEVTLAWEPVEDATKYCVSIYKNGSYDIQSMDITDCEYTIKGLTNGEEYEFLVQSFRYGKWSPVATYLLFKVRVCPRPKPYVISTDDGQATIEWDTIPCASKYAISERMSDGTFKISTLDFECTESKAQYTIYDLGNGYDHSIVVQACTNGYWSSLNNTWDDAIAHPEGKMFPEIQSTIASYSTIDVSWDSVPGAIKYAVSTSIDDGETWTIHTLNCYDLNFQVQNLDEDTEYKVLVQVNVMGIWSLITLSDYEYVSTLWSSPKNVHVVSKDSGTVTLGWDAVPNADRYCVSRYLGDGKYEIIDMDIINNVSTIDNLANGYTYQFLVQSCIAGKWSTISDLTKLIEVALDDPSWPTIANIVGYTSTNSSITVNWESCPGSKYYAVSISKNQKPWVVQTLTCQDLSYTVNYLEEDCSYVVLVQSYIMGSWTSIDISDSITASTTGISPKNVKVLELSSGHVKLGWDSVAGADKYCVSRFNNGIFQIYDMDVDTLYFDINNLANGYTYQFLVQAHVGNAWSTCTDLDKLVSASLDNPDWPTIPKIKSTQSTNNTISAWWDSCPGAEKYAISTSKNNEGWVVHTLECQDCQYTISGLLEDCTYEVLVQARIMGSWTLIDKSDSAIVSTKGISPTNVRVLDKKSGYVKLGWDVVPDADKYCVSRYINGAYKILNMDITQSSFEIYDLANGRTHQFLVQAHVGNAWSTCADLNKLISVSLDNPDWPTIPKIKSTQSTNNTISAWWDSCPGAEKYAISTSKNNEGWVVHTLECQDCQYTISGLLEDCTYKVLVQARIMGSWTLIDKSDSAIVSTKGISPSNVRVLDKNSGYVKLGWDVVPGADKYCVSQYSNGSYSIFDMDIMNDYYEIDDLPNGYSYQFLVQAHVKGVWSTCFDLNKLITVSLDNPDWPTVPKILNAQSGINSITINWDSCPGSKKFAISTSKYSEPWVIHTLDCVDFSFTINGLEEDTTYRVLVQAYILGRWTPIEKSDYIDISTDGISPDNVHVIEKSSGTVTLGWDHVPGADKYCVSRYLDDGSFYIYNMDFFASQFTIGDLGNGYTYRFLVQAHVGGIWSTWTDLGKLISVALDDPSWPTKPQNITAISTQYNKISVSWDRLTGASYYAVSTRKPGGLWTNHTLNCAEMSYTITDIRGGEIYEVIVQGWVENKWTVFDESTDTKLVEVKKDPTRPRLVISDVSDNTATFSWNLISGASKYCIVFKTESGSYATLKDEVIGSSIKVTGISPGYYLFGVRAYLSSGNWSDIDGGDLEYQYIPNIFGVTIMSNPRSYAEQMARYYIGKGMDYPINDYKDKGAPDILTFATICYEEATAEGVDPAVLFCQAMHETGWLHFGGLVQAWQCNFGGLGATGPGHSGAVFPDVRTGLRAQVQHLKAYACTLPCVNVIVDPRFHLVQRGCAPCVTDLNGRWAVPGTGYGQAIIALMNEMFRY